MWIHTQRYTMKTNSTTEIEEIIAFHTFSAFLLEADRSLSLAKLRNLLRMSSKIQKLRNIPNFPFAYMFDKK